ncbi:MAG: C40 family peptidase [Sporolactobacillus sp.]
MLSNQAEIAVPVATVWTAPDAVRLIDEPAIAPIPNLKRWLSTMSREENIALCTEKRLQTQVLFGDSVIITERSGDWVRVAVPAQASHRDPAGYPGWMPACQLIEKADRSVEAGDQVMVQSQFAPLSLQGTKQTLILSFATFLPLVAEEEDSILVQTPIGTGSLRRADVCLNGSSLKGTGIEIVRNAQRFLDLPYLWAGMSAYGYDCSGFSYSMLRASGYWIPRDADDQAEKGQAIPVNEMQPGDLLYFAYDKGRGEVHHVGIYAGEGRMVHSPTPGKKVSQIELTGTLLEEEICTVRRYWKEGIK